MSTDSETMLGFFGSDAPGHTPVSAEAAPTQQAPIQITPEQTPVEAAPDALTPAPLAQPEPEAQRMVPLDTLIETRRRAQAAEERHAQAERQAAQLAETLARLSQPQQRAQPQPEPIDPEIDPTGYIREMEARNEQRFLNLRLDMSEQTARAKHGTDVIDRALTALDTQGPAFRQAFINQPDPYAALVDWHQGQTMRQTIGDPVKYEADLTARIRAQIIAEMRTGSPPPSNLPPSLASATKATSAPVAIQDTGDFFNTMMNRRK